MPVRPAPFATRSFRPLTLLAAVAALGVGPAFAETRVGADYIAVVLEAESNDAQDARWVTTLPNTPAILEDSDGNHSAGAVGQAYLELLPDTRVFHADEMLPGVNFWGPAGIGPRVDWSVDFPEAGRYHVHVRAYSTGTEDNGLHVGLNGQWPEYGKQLQLCTAGQGWSWSSRQRGSGGGHCGIEKTIWLEVPSAGVHTFSVSAREDGFELDRLMLIKDTSGNTRNCSPDGADDIQCRDGAIDAPDDLVDLFAFMVGGDEPVAPDDVVDLVAKVRNQDRFDTALAAELALEFSLGDDWELVSFQAPCSATPEGLVCALGDVAPSAPSDAIDLPFQVRALREGTLEIFGRLSTASVDGVTDNDTTRKLVDVVAAPEPAELALTLAVPAPMVPGDDGQIVLGVSNTGAGAASAATLEIDLPDTIEVRGSADGCSANGAGLACDLGTLAAGAERTVAVDVEAVQAGVDTIAARLAADNLEGSGPRRSTVLVVSEPQPEPDPDAGSDTGDTAGEGAPKDEASSGGGSGGLGVLLGLGGALAWRRRR